LARPLISAFFRITVGVGDIVEVMVLRMVRIVPVSENVRVEVSMAVMVTAAAVLRSGEPVLIESVPAFAALLSAFARRQKVGEGFAAMLPLTKTTKTAAYLSIVSFSPAAKCQKLTQR